MRSWHCCGASHFMMHSRRDRCLRTSCGAVANTGFMASTHLSHLLSVGSPIVPGGSKALYLAVTAPVLSPITLAVHKKTMHTDLPYGLDKFVSSAIPESILVFRGRPHHQMPLCVARRLLLRCPSAHIGSARYQCTRLLMCRAVGYAI